MDLFARTWESLDFGVVLERLSAECRTEMGRVRALQPDFKTSLEEVRRVRIRLCVVVGRRGSVRPSREVLSTQPVAVRCSAEFLFLGPPFLFLGPSRSCRRP